jgi:Glycosyl hydrolases family 16
MDAGSHGRCGAARRFIAMAAVVLTTSQLTGCAGLSVVSASPPEPTNCPTTAAVQNDWGVPDREDDFDTSSSLSNWHLYDGPGHAGNGRRIPAAIAVSAGLVTISGDSQGNSGGMGWDSGQEFGRWEVCARSGPSAPGYHSVLLLWPDAEDWPIGGEIDFMEAIDPTRQSVEGWLHHGPDDRREGGSVSIDATQWHAWAVEWSPDRITLFVNGAQWWTTTDTATFPPRSLHLCMQVDNFGGDIASGGQQQVDWARQYSLR